jgi:hypothetical protein
VDWRRACLAGLAVLAVSGCGSSTKSPTTQTTASTPPTTTATGATGATGPTQATAPATASGPTKPTKAVNPTNPARATFIGRADQICAAANTGLVAPQRKVDAAFKAEQTKGSAAHRLALAGAVRAESTVASAELARLRGLTPPAADRAAVGRYEAAIASQVGLIDQLAAAVAANDGARLTAVGDKLAAGKTAVDGLASAYGFKVCGNAAP